MNQFSQGFPQPPTMAGHPPLGHSGLSQADMLSQVSLALFCVPPPLNFFGQIVKFSFKKRAASLARTWVKKDSISNAR